MSAPADWTRLSGALSLGLGRQPLPEVGGLGLEALDEPARALALLALLGQRARLAPPAPPPPTAADLRGLPEDPRPMLPPPARDALRRLDRRLDAESRRQLAFLLISAINSTGYRPHIFDLPALETMLKLAGDDLGPVERAWLGGAVTGKAIVDSAVLTQAQHLVAFAQARRDNPAAARADLAARLAGEPSDLRGDLVAHLNIGLSGEDRALLESCLGDRSIRVRENAKVLLERLPGSAGYEARLAAARASLGVETKGLLRRRKHLTFTPPREAARDGSAPFVLLNLFGLTELIQGLGVAAAELPDMAPADEALLPMLARAAMRDGDLALAATFLLKLAAPNWPGDLLAIQVQGPDLAPEARRRLVDLTFQPTVELGWGYNLILLGKFLGGALPPALARRVLVSTTFRDRMAHLAASPDGDGKVDFDEQLLPLIALIPPSLAVEATAAVAAIPLARRPKTTALLAFLAELAALSPSA